jgi:hypothetical protein
MTTCCDSCLTTAFSLSPIRRISRQCRTAEREMSPGGCGTQWASLPQRAEFPQVQWRQWSLRTREGSLRWRESIIRQ